MKKILKRVGVISLFGLMMIGLAACGNQQSADNKDSGYNSSISKGLNAVAENKFDKALTYFDNALTQKPKDSKAKAYRDQTQAYLDTQSELKDGEVQKAVTTVTAGTKVTNGAKSLNIKLSDLKQTAKDDLAEYRQLKQDVADQLKITDGNYDTGIVKQCQAINWRKKPYLKKLKPDVDKLLKQAGQQSSTSSSSSSTATSSSSSSTTTKAVSAADKKEAEQMRTNIVQSDPDSWDSAALAQVPDSVIVAATKKSNDMGGDPGTTANMIAEQYPNIKKNGSSDSDTDDSANGLSASEAKNKLNSFEFYTKNKSHIELTGQEQTSDGWEFTYSFVGGSTGGVLVVNNDGKIADKTFSGIEGETGSWK
ncbi:hypothetical protein [Lactiplantibacillus argentoratensis]|uniref:hypothetical protein n=1 Tax=Lactiplantibacillus argentoratensis TaxID=271881 RepID=UPI001B32F183|nr:hypothetical protein [Lactiplantibacillus argentoratensis]MBP5809474.1 hypothetical protein [Lactiplantibacillus argentoratensis]